MHNQDFGIAYWSNSPPRFKFLDLGDVVEINIHMRIVSEEDEFFDVLFDILDCSSLRRRRKKIIKLRKIKVKSLIINA